MPNQRGAGMGGSARSCCGPQRPRRPGGARRRQRGKQNLLSGVECGNTPAHCAASIWLKAPRLNFARRRILDWTLVCRSALSSAGMPPRRKSCALHALGRASAQHRRAGAAERHSREARPSVAASRWRGAVWLRRLVVQAGRCACDAAAPASVAARPQHAQHHVDPRVWRQCDGRRVCSRQRVRQAAAADSLRAAAASPRPRRTRPQAHALPLCGGAQCERAAAGVPASADAARALAQPQRLVGVAAGSGGRQPLLPRHPPGAMDPGALRGGGQG